MTGFYMIASLTFNELMKYTHESKDFSLVFYSLYPGLLQNISTVLMTESRFFHTTLKCIKKCWEGFTQPAIACSKLTIETLEQGVKYVQS